MRHLEGHRFADSFRSVLVHKPTRNLNADDHRARAAWRLSSTGRSAGRRPSYRGHDRSTRSCVVAAARHAPRFRPAGDFASGIPATFAEHAMVVSMSKYASEAGVEIMKAGGNAVDAPSPPGFALAVTYPSAGNIGGGGFMNIRMADGRIATLDYLRGRAARGHARTCTSRTASSLTRVGSVTRVGRAGLGRRNGRSASQVRNDAAREGHGAGDSARRTRIHDRHERRTSRRPVQPAHRALRGQRALLSRRAIAPRRGQFQATGSCENTQADRRAGSKAF